VEFVITYYVPRRDNANIIVEKFVDACSRIVDHFANLRKIEGTLMVAANDSRSKYQDIGIIGNERKLYQKPASNLYYMDVYDDENVDRIHGLSEAEFIPQMTFKSKAYDTLEIMKGILASDDKFKKGRDMKSDAEINLSYILIIEEIVDTLFQEYNAAAVVNGNKPIPTGTETFRILKLYVFLIYYKLYMFIFYRNEILEGDYLKDHLTFSSRHRNSVLYNEIKKILKDKYGIHGAEHVQRLLVQPSILTPLYEREYGNHEAYLEGMDYTEDGEYKYNWDAFKDRLSEDDPHYGNPLFSVHSYFDHFEKKEADWLFESKYDIYSTQFDIKNNEVLIEDRQFQYAMALYLRNIVGGGKLGKSNAISLGNMLTIVNKLYGEKKYHLMNLEYNPKKRKLTRRCKKGYYRNANFKCVMTKNAIKERKLLRTEARRSMKLLSKVSTKTRTQKTTPLSKSTSKGASQELTKTSASFIPVKI
jgi:hypothetical protein